MRIKADVDELIQLVSSVTEAYTTAFFLADNRKRLLNLWRFYSLSNNVISDAAISFGVGPIGRVAESLKPFDLSKFSERDSGLLRLYSRNEDIKSFFAVPVMTGGTLDGVLCIDSKKAFVFATKDQKLLTLFAEQFASLINNIGVQQFVDTEASDVAALHDFCSRIVSTDDVESILQLTLDSIAQLVTCDGCFLSLSMDGGDGEARLFRVETTRSHRNVKGLIFSEQDGLAGSIVRGGESFLLSNRRRDLGSYIFTPSESVGRVTSFLGVPLLTQDNVLGLVCLIDSEEDAFNQRDLRVVSIMADNASLAIANAKVKQRTHALSTTTDGLTGLHNFSGFQESLAAAFLAASQKRRPLSLVIMDVDNFKEINRNSGYEVGNQVLRNLAQLLLNLGRNYDIGDDDITVARYGSDEFALILPNARKERALSVAEAIHKMIEDPTFIAPTQGVRVSIKTGVSCFTQDSRSRNDLVDNALRSLNTAKSNDGKTTRNDMRNIGIRA